MLTVGPHDRIGISGPNGTGKTTLVRTLLRTIAMREQYSGIPLPRLTITQNTTDQDAREAMRRLTALTPTDRGDVLSAFAQLTSTQAASSPVATRRRANCASCCCAWDCEITRI